MESKKTNIWRIILILIAIIFIALLISIFRKFMILSKLENLSKDALEKDNYYVQTYALKENSIEILKSYNKDSKYLSMLETMNKQTGEKGKLTVYSDNEDKISIIETQQEKIAILGDKTVGGKIGVNAYASYGQGVWSKLQLAITSDIGTENIGNKECYVINSVNGWKKWVNKETGLILRECNNGDVTDFNYEFDIVKDENIMKPDTSDCKIQN